MKLFGSRKKETEKLEELIGGLGSIGKAVSTVYSLSESERIELCRIMFLLVAKNYGVKEGLPEEHLSSAEERILGGSFSRLLREGHGVRIVLKWGGKLFTAQGEFKAGTILTLGKDGSMDQLKFIKEDDIRSIIEAVLSSLRS